MTFDQLPLHDDILDALDDMGFRQCTPIQEQAIPHIIEGRDIIACAQTGTGKTAAFLLPILNRIADGEFPEDTVNCIIMSPTRELAMQIDNQLEGFGYYVNASSLAIYGGTDGQTFARQQRSLLMGADIVVATPGRLLAHLQLGRVDLSRLNVLILDEADRMLDMGFYDDIMQIVSHLPRQRQTLKFSATMPPKIQQLAQKLLNDPVQVKIAVSKPADKIHQSAYILNEPQKFPVLRHILDTNKGQRIIVFASSKLNVRQLVRQLRQAHYQGIGEMHSDLDQSQRDEVMRQYKSGHITTLIATDIVARGIDIDDIAIVVNYDTPRDTEDYVHRVGRTARAEAEGQAITLVNPADQRYLRQIEQFLGYQIPKNPLPEELGPAPNYRGERSNRSKRSKKPRHNKPHNPQTTSDKPNNRKPRRPRKQ